MKQLKLTVRGKVQGVWFRAYTQQQALKLGLCGFVMNQPDGSVLAVAEGDDTSLTTFTGLLRQGPADAEVNALDILEAPVEAYTDFIIKR